MGQTLTEQIDRMQTLMHINRTNDVVKEGFGNIANGAMSLAKKLLGIKNPEEKKTAVLNYIESGVNQNMTQAYNQFKQEDPAKADKYLEFYVLNPNDFPKWNGSEFVATGNTEMLR